MLYYGDPATLEVLNKNLIDSVKKQNDWEVFLQTVNGMVVPDLEADLNTVFVSYPPPDSTQQNVVSVLWALRMVEYMQEIYGSTSRNPQSGYGERTQTRYEQLLARVKKGDMMIVGAVRRSGMVPKVGIYTPPRFVEDTTIVEPILLNSLTQHGLRR